MSSSTNLVICALLITQTLSKCEGKLNGNLAEKPERSDLSGLAGNTDSQMSLTREARSLLPIILFGIQHPLIMKAMVTIGKITLPLLAYYLQIVLLQTITENQGSGNYLEELLSSYKIPQSTKDVRYLYTYNVTYEDGAYKVYNSTVFPIDNAYDMLFRKFEKLGKITNIDIKYHRIPTPRRTTIYSTAVTGRMTMTTPATWRNTGQVTDNPQIKQNKPTGYNRVTNINENNNAQANQISEQMYDLAKFSHNGSQRYQDTPLLTDQDIKAHIQNYQKTDDNNKYVPYIKENVQKQQNKPSLNELTRQNNNLTANNIEIKNKENVQNGRPHDDNRFINEYPNDIDPQISGNKIQDKVQQKPTKNAGSPAILKSTPTKKTYKNPSSTSKIPNSHNIPSVINQAGINRSRQAKRPTLEKQKAFSDEKNDQVIQKTSDEPNLPFYNTGYDRYGFPVANNPITKKQYRNAPKILEDDLSQQRHNPDNSENDTN